MCCAAPQLVETYVLAICRRCVGAWRLVRASRQVCLPCVSGRLPALQEPIRLGLCPAWRIGAQHQRGVDGWSLGAQVPGRAAAGELCGVGAAARGRRAHALRALHGQAPGHRAAGAPGGCGRSVTLQDSGTCLCWTARTLPYWQHTRIALCMVVQVVHRSRHWLTRLHIHQAACGGLCAYDVRERGSSLYCSGHRRWWACLAAR